MPTLPPAPRLHSVVLRGLALLAAGLAGCAAPPTPSASLRVLQAPDMSQAAAVPADVLELAELSQPEDAVPMDAAYVMEETIPASAEVGAVRPGLNLRISVLVGGQPEFEEPSRQVSSEGTVDAPLIGKVPVAGLTLQQVEALLTTRYSQYLVQPQVVVEYVQREGSTISPWGYITVLGRVRTPGKLPIPATRDLTVSGAIQRAGGFDTSARSSSIRVTRQLPGGNTQRIKVDLKAYARGDIKEDILLQAGDVVFVPESVW